MGMKSSKVPLFLTRFTNLKNRKFFFDSGLVSSRYFPYLCHENTPPPLPRRPLFPCPISPADDAFR